jgi:hypothetical protein
MDRLSLFFKVRQLQKEKGVIEKNANELVKSETVTPDDESEYMQAITTIEEKIQILKSRHLIKKAEVLFIPIPKREHPSWERSVSIMNHWQLSPKGMTDLKEAIRKERSYYITWISAITGLFGAATGLFAIIKSL